MSSRTLLIASATLLLFSGLLGLLNGAFTADVVSSIQAVLGVSDDAQLTNVMQFIRLPRVLGGALIGASLCAAGAAFQGLFRNPLVSPDVLGVSSGAALGAVVALLIGAGIILVQVISFAAGLCTVLLAYLLARMFKQHQETGINRQLPLILAGVVLGSLMGAMMSAVQMLATTQNNLPGIIFWLLGSLGNLTLAQCGYLALSYAIGIALLLSQSRSIDQMLLGDVTASSLGVDVQKTRLTVIAAATLLAASTVTFAGVIGWIGLVLPHITRLITGSGLRQNLIVGSLLGASFMVLMDLLSRSAFAVEIPIGICTALIGLPIFIAAMAHNVRRKALQ